jgi:large subunit ribosomal protein L15
MVHGIKGFSGVKLLGQVCPSFPKYKRMIGAHRRLHQPNPSLPLPPLKLRLSRYSKQAAQAIIDAGGDITAVYHNALALRQAAHPEKFFGREVKEALPVRKTDICELCWVGFVCFAGPFS